MQRHFLLTFSILLIHSYVSGQEYDISKLTLQETIEIGLENNLTLKRSELNFLNLESSLIEAKGQQLPSFSAGLSTGFRWGRSINPVTNQFVEKKNVRIGNINVAGSSSLPVYAGGQLQNRVKQAKVDVEIGRMDVETTKNDIQLNIINLFVNVAFAKEQMNIANSQLNTVREQMERTRKMVNAGSLARAELLDLEAQTATAELEVINANNSHRMARLNLSQQLLIPFTDDFDIAVPDVEVENMDMVGEGVAEIYTTASGFLPQVRAAELGITSAEYGIRVAKGGFTPTLGLDARAFSNYVGPITFGASDQIFKQIGNNFAPTVEMTLSIPVFSQFRNRVSLQRARVQKRLNEVQEIEVKNQLMQDIETAYTAAYAARQSYRSSVKRVEALEEAFRMASQRFELGAINAVDYQLAQNNLFNAQADLINAKYEFVFRAKVLDFYLGKPLTLN